MLATYILARCKAVPTERTNKGNNGLWPQRLLWGCDFRTLVNGLELQNFYRLAQTFWMRCLWCRTFGSADFAFIRTIRRPFTAAAIASIRGSGMSADGSLA